MLEILKLFDKYSIYIIMCLNNPTLYAFKGNAFYVIFLYSLH